ncbi:MAG: DUF2178 domain-containing protein [Methanomicrobiales archaeon]|jgi:uncharacterized membrane protein|nr:DUF2178 domain-containing protein [Methanomicrobiales archaeon]
MNKHLHKNGFLAIIGIVALLEVIVFYFAITVRSPIICAIGLIIGIIIITLARTQIQEIVEDERTELIVGKAATRTLHIVLILVSAYAFSGVAVILTLPHHPCGQIVSNFTLSYLLLPCMMILLYTALRYYYAYKYGGFESEE